MAKFKIERKDLKTGNWKKGLLSYSSRAAALKRAGKHDRVVEVKK